MENKLVKQAFASLQAHLRIPLYANAYMLVTNQAATAVLGLFYWTLAARLYPVEVVGENSAIISSIIFLAMLSELSLKSAMTRFVPRAGAKTAQLILVTLGINFLAALAVSSFLLTVGRHFSITAGLLTDIPFSPVWLALAAMLWTVFYVQDGVLTGMRRARWVLIKNMLLSLAKIALLVLFFRSFANMGLVISWFAPVPLIVLGFGVLIFWRFLPEHLKLDITHTRPITRTEIFTSIGGDYLGGILAETSTRLLPLLVLYFLGKEPTAYFNQAWVVAMPFYLVATNMGSSFVVESSANMKQVAMHSRRILRQMILILVPVVVLIWIGAPFLLHIFGKSYAEESFVLLRWLLLATWPFMFNAWFLSYSRVMGHARSIVAVQALQLVVTLGFSYFWLPVFGITSVGMAWLLAQSLISLGVLTRAISILWPQNVEEISQSPLTNNHFIRRVDWRFLLNLNQIEKSICLVDGPLAQAVAAFSRENFDRHSTPDGICDLAVAVNPDQGALLTASRALRPEGVLYAEWLPLSTGGLGGIRKRLHQAGYEWVKWYIPFPNPARPRFWIPLGSFRAASHYIASWLFPGMNLFQRGARILLREILSLLLPAGLVPYMVTIAGKGSTPVPDLLDVIRDEWQQKHPGQSADGLSFLIKTGGLLLFSKIVCLVFSQPESSFAEWVVKVPRLAEDLPSLQREKQLLDDLDQIKNDRRAMPVVPQSLFTRKLNHVEIYGQTALLGDPLTSAISGDSFTGIALRLTEAQIALAESTRIWAGDTSSGEIISALLQKSTALSGRVANLPDLEQTRRVLDGLRPLPVVCVHNDFTPWNIVDDAGKLGVFDWGDAAKQGLPLLDLVYGLATAAFLLDHAQSADEMNKSYLTLLDPYHARGKVFAECLNRYAASLGIPSDSIAPLRLMTWMYHSFNELEIYAQEVINNTSPYQSVCTPMWIAELQCQEWVE